MSKCIARQFLGYDCGECDPCKAAELKGRRAERDPVDVKLEMADHLVAAARHHCAQQERWAHADFFFNMNPAGRKALAIEGAHPWRGAMSPSVLALVNVLEEMGEYEETGLSVPANAG